MKHFSVTFIVILVVVVNTVSSQMTPEHAKFIGEVNKCKTESGATDEEVEDLYNRIIPTTKSAKCFNACVMEKTQILQGGKFVPDNLNKIVEMDKTNLKGKDGKTLVEAMNDINAECKDIVDSDKCEFAAKLRSCLNAAARKREYCPNVF
ncbi:General odorant-binding protein 19d [Pseudolycoriella hygida]|uniref:General odorant-binding protein 19d n=1 Tax=Pseudolycoriella hygida TaxID=35572 RepID=A0A9Q0RY87_9DIPT|nr:General odorant-binding protein 19d [Pseudolycoriella hygida]